MPFQRQVYLPGSEPLLKDESGTPWTPLYWHPCTFSPVTFGEVMMNLIRNPNINSNHLFRADILLDVPYTNDFANDVSEPPRIAHFEELDLHTVMIRRLIPRNVLVDKPLDQSCLLYHGEYDSEIRSLVVYLPHISSPSDSPFYHPTVRGIAFLHVFSPRSHDGVVSIHYSFFDSEPQSPSLDRTAQHLLAVLHKHGQGLAAGYVKRVHHDAVLPQAVVQNTYARLKAKYARSLIATWVEATDPAKHVFEDLGIAAFLIELWAEVYPSKSDFPGFVDIGCGNGLLVHILIEEGYSGSGFDARRRKSWSTYSPKAQECLKELVLMPKSVLQEAGKDRVISRAPATDDEGMIPETHSGEFPKGTFIISNHADELTPWTPILANISESPFMIIPCCSHNLAGARFRAPPPKDAGASSSAYASLVDWVTKLAGNCGWEVEKEMLRIPSTRNTALIGRRRTAPFSEVDVSRILADHGGATGWEENAMKLVKSCPRGH
jgi:tRNASer (uridine44-2'-O)-methyltransferase